MSILTISPLSNAGRPAVQGKSTKPDGVTTLAFFGGFLFGLGE
jgi:hypothetical protein